MKGFPSSTFFAPNIVVMNNENLLGVANPGLPPVTFPPFVGFLVCPAGGTEAPAMGKFFAFFAVLNIAFFNFFNGFPSNPPKATAPNAIPSLPRPRPNPPNAAVKSATVPPIINNPFIKSFLIFTNFS